MSTPRARDGSFKRAQGRRATECPEAKRDSRFYCAAGHMARGEDFEWLSPQERKQRCKEHS